MDRGALRAVVHGVANSLGTTEEVQHSISFDFIVNLLCVISSTHISLTYCYCYVTSVVSDSVRPHDGSSSGSPVPRIFQVRVLERVAISFSSPCK